MRAPAFQFYADDFVAGTVELNTTEIGAYMLLLCYQWNKGFIPNDDDIIRRITKITQAFPLDAIKAKFKCNRGKLLSARLEAEREKQKQYRLKQAENGAKGGRPAKPKPNPSLSSGLTQTKAKKSSPSPSPIIREVAPLSRFQVPSIDDVKAECQRIEIDAIEAEKFVSYYQSVGWKVGRKPMKDWKAALTGWKSRMKTFAQPQKQNGTAQDFHSIKVSDCQ